MTTFVKINVNDIVYDKQAKVEGKVKFIDNRTKTAKVEVIIHFNEETSERTTKLIESKLFNLLVVKKAKQQPTHDPNKWWSAVRKFHLAFGHPVADKPTSLTLERMTSRKVWEAEESVEAIHASCSNVDEFNWAVDKLIQGIENARKKSLKEEFPTDDLSRIVAQADAITDGTYFLQGDFVEMGIKPDKVFDAVQASNLSKLFSDGRPRYRESDGKIIKSENFFPPEEKIKEEIQRQLDQ
ncbi:hypothetical protein [Siminovitchia sp. 179-K 8D1 HS]|uniref:hypothetical protein n=1 Tax=Siminovitchia sp. 179-K 8D1 HS TaxID=3142385 RepID=UPI00399F753F